MKYRAKRDFLGVTKGMEFPTGEEMEITIHVNTRKDLNIRICIDPKKYPDDFELVEEPKYTDSDLEEISDFFYKYWINDGCTAEESIKQAIAELKQSKEKK